MTKELTINYSDANTIKTLKETVAKGATESEFKMFSEMCKATGLNPFKREIWFIKASGKVQMMTGVNGFYTIANNHPQFDGIETEVVEEGGRIVKAIAKVYRKDRKIPMTVEAYWEEYAKPYGNWKTMPRVMITKCAESMALRKAFPQQMNGLYTQEEMPANFSQPKDEPVQIVEIEPETHFYNFSEISEEQEEWLQENVLSTCEYKKVEEGVFCLPQQLNPDKFADYYIGTSF